MPIDRLSTCSVVASWTQSAGTTWRPSQRPPVEVELPEVQYRSSGRLDQDRRQQVGAAIGVGEQTPGWADRLAEDAADPVRRRHVGQVFREEVVREAGCHRQFLAQGGAGDIGRHLGGILWEEFRQVLIQAELPLPDRYSDESRHHALGDRMDVPVLFRRTVVAVLEHGLALDQHHDGTDVLVVLSTAQLGGDGVRHPGPDRATGRRSAVGRGRGGGRCAARRQQERDSRTENASPEPAHPADPRRPACHFANRPRRRSPSQQNPLATGRPARFARGQSSCDWTSTRRASPLPALGVHPRVVMGHPALRARPRCSAARIRTWTIRTKI